MGCMDAILCVIRILHRCLRLIFLKNFCIYLLSSRF
jgi:hypothetical protein